MYLTKYGICAQSFGSQQWDTGFAIQALLASNFTDEIGDVLKRGHDFIKKSQVCYFSLLELTSFALIMK
jgi:squalene cyclase